METLYVKLSHFKLRVLPPYIVKILNVENYTATVANRWIGEWVREVCIAHNPLRTPNVLDALATREQVRFK